jgi:serine/threonine-protein kinase RsbW
MNLVLDLEVPAGPEYVAVVRLVVGSLAVGRRELSDERVDDLKLAVSEACTNAIEAHVRLGGKAPIGIRMYEAADRIEIHVTDQGGGFDPDGIRGHPPFTNPERLNFERGLGIPLIRSLMDELEFATVDGGTTVRMVLRAPPAELADPDELDAVMEGALDEP